MPDLLDVNVLVAFAIPDHEHHLQAKSYWEEEAERPLFFNSITRAGFLRAICAPQIVRDKTVTVS